MYPVEESPNQLRLPKVSCHENKNGAVRSPKAQNNPKNKVSRKVVFRDEAGENSGKGSKDLDLVDGCKATNHSNVNVGQSIAHKPRTGLLEPDSDMNWIGGVERKLINKNRPQCKEDTVKAKEFSKENSDKQLKPMEKFCDGVRLMVDTDDLDYKDNVLNPQDPDNEILLLEDNSVLVLDTDLDDSDGLDGVTTASNMYCNNKSFTLQADPASMLKVDKEQLLKDNPGLAVILNKLVVEKIKEVIPGGIIQKGTVNKTKCNTRMVTRSRLQTE